FFQAEDGIRDFHVTGVQTCALPICKDYYFLGVEGFRKKIQEEAFIEWEEVYPDHFYGTLKSEVKRIWEHGKAVIFDVDVIGGLRSEERRVGKECRSRW